MQVNAEVAIRDQYTCLRCGRRGWDIGHILPKGRYPELKHTKKNLVTLCRRCHVDTENVRGRRELLALMTERHGYTYDEDQYRGYRNGSQP